MGKTLNTRKYEIEIGNVLIALLNLCVNKPYFNVYPMYKITYLYKVTLALIMHK